MIRLKALIRESLIYFNLGVTKNLSYDIYTKKILKHHLRRNSNCVDIGAHKGEMLRMIRKYSPSGQHLAVEPIESLYNELHNSNYSNVKVLNCAVSDFEGSSEFTIVENDLAYSGLKERLYKKKEVKLKKLSVQVRKLDTILSSSRSLALIKIDVEGGEYFVIKGGAKVINRTRPLILFEFGLGASDYYNVDARMMFDLIQSFDYKLYTMYGFLNSDQMKSLSIEELEKFYLSGSEYYFVASPD